MDTPSLFAFGCSYTYGHGLEDCFELYPNGNNGPGKLPTRLGYTNIIAKKIGRRVINCASPGSSNKLIMHTINMIKQEEYYTVHQGKKLKKLQTYWREKIPAMNPDTDAVIIQWSYIDRHCVLDQYADVQLDKVENLGPWVKKGRSPKYYKFVWSTYDDQISVYHYINYADLTLKNMGFKKVLHLPPPLLSLHRSKLEKGLVMADTDITRHSCDKALDGGHPGPLSQQAYAEHLLEDYAEYLK
ncbi:MAG: hypothetical protein CMG35_12150 [Candidatus Marinimicrobia bacterium]|nr:hypothetical protein [Candidatus Neomarinimicrobiota bacterium]MBO03384.1 hypothetical protein [Candidatus Neomarinimicrobiota bacterium]|tara:strand:- start:5799 stop:6527 length:729 start_codon:yes stop_codon:yes gene_type:complete